MTTDVHPSAAGRDDVSAGRDDVSAGRPDADPPAPRTRRAPWFELITGVLLLAVAAVAVLAVVRHATMPGAAVLPESWARLGHPMPTRPLLGPALLTAWQLDPAALVVLGVLGVLYGVGIGCVRRRGERWSPWRSTAFAAGLLVAALATCSSIGVYDMALFTSHMVGHLMLVMLAPVLLSAGHPLSLLVAATADPWTGRVRRVLRSRAVTLLLAPPVGLACYAAVIVISHLTGLMDTIMQNMWAGQLEHLVYVLVGLQFFIVVVPQEPIRWDLTTPARWVMLAISMAVDTFTGVTLLMTSVPIAMMAGDMHMSGLAVNTLSDTHTGGAIMWVGGDGLMAIVMIALGRRWLRSADLRQRDRRGVVERVRQSTFAERTGGQGEFDDEFDDTEARREQYNKWLASLEERSH